MNAAEITAAATQLIAEVEKLIPACMQNPEDRDNSRGNVTLMIVAQDGQIFGRMFGTDNRTRRGTSRVAWQKATQVWMTAQATGRFEQQVYGGANVDPGQPCTAAVVFHPVAVRDENPRQRAENAHRHDQDDRQRQRPAFVLC